MDTTPSTGIRKHAKCPKCGAFERHRLQKLVLAKLSKRYEFSKMNILHFAPETHIRQYFQENFESYHSADLFMNNVDFKEDLRRLKFDKAKYNFVFASHILEHIKEDMNAISEIRRILTPNGIAILPVPIISEKTTEYPEPNPFE